MMQVSSAALQARCSAGRFISVQSNVVHCSVFQYLTMQFIALHFCTELLKNTILFDGYLNPPELALGACRKLTLWKYDTHQKDENPQKFEFQSLKNPREKNPKNLIKIQKKS